MSIASTRDELVDALGLAARVASTKTTLPSLGGVLIDASTDGVSIHATDTELSVSLTLETAKSDAEEKLLLPARLVGDVARTLPAGEVTLASRSDEGDVEITAGGARFHIKTLPAADFPPLPESEGSGVTLPAQDLVAAIERVARAASKDEVRAILTGVLVQASGDSLTLVATDSYRLAVDTRTLPKAIDGDFDANLPARALRELARVVGQAGADEVAVATAGQQVSFDAGRARLVSRLIDGQFPSWKQLIPETFEREVTLNAAELLDVCRRVSQLAQRNAPLRLAFAEGELTVAAVTPDVGDATETIPAQWTGEALEIAFNPQYLLEGIESIASEELTLHASSPHRPGLLRPVGDDAFTYLVMPIRLND